ncbi:MAG: hopanoid-associated sugar epimerase [Gammaproteobacteria bacterium]
MTTLVTGATGFVGSALVRCLLNAGHQVRVMVRSTSARANIQGLDVEIVTGDLAEPDSLQNAVKACDSLFHVAADYRLWVRNSSELYRVNVEGTTALMQAAADAGLSKIVYTSSVATLGLNSDGSPSDENTPVSLGDMIGHYKRSKYMAEQAVQHMIDQQNLPAIIVNPSTPIGPRDIKPTPTGRMVLDAACGRMPAYVDTGLNVAHVDDVAKGHLLAFEQGEFGERYVLGGQDMTLQQIFEVISQITGHSPPKVKLPHNLVLPIAYLSEAWAWLIKGPEPRATVDGVRMSKKLMYFSSDKARRELGYATRPAREALADAVDWFMKHNYCAK